MSHRLINHQLTPEDAAYIAGLVDGEGSISLTHRHGNENRHIVVSISNTEKPVLTFCLDKIGAGKITNKRTSQAHHTPSFTYSISNRKALTLLEQIAPYLHTYKKLRAELVLKEYIRLTTRNGKYSVELAREREQFVNAFLSIKPSHPQNPT